MNGAESLEAAHEVLAEDALIGQLVRLYSALEYAGGLLINAVTRHDDPPELRDPDSRASKDHARLLTNSLSGHAGWLRGNSARIASIHGLDVDDFGNLIAELAVHGCNRKLICHGQWRRLPDGLLCCALWSREAVKLLRDYALTHDVIHDRVVLTADDLRDQIAGARLTLDKMETLVKATNEHIDRQPPP